jgi:hypothetical protein
MLKRIPMLALFALLAAATALLPMACGSDSGGNDASDTSMTSS